MEQEYRISVQCTDTTTGETGDFIAGFENGRRIALSPIFQSLAELYPWMHKNGWKSDEYISLGTETKFVPWRVVRVAA